MNGTLLCRFLCETWLLFTSVLSVQTSVPSQKYASIAMCLKQKAEKLKKKKERKKISKGIWGVVFLRHSISQIPPSISFRVKLRFKYIFWLISRNFERRENYDSD